MILIDRTALLEHFNSGALLFEPKVREIIESMPEAIVRCKDCKWWNGHYRECENPNMNIPDSDEYMVTPAGFYCGWAERRTDEAN